MASMNILAAIVYPKQTLITLVLKLQDLVSPQVPNFLSVRVVLIAFVQLYMCTICINQL